MGAIVAIMGEPGDPELLERLERMLERSPYRGTPERHFEHGLAIGIQTLGWDASLATSGNWTVAIHGFIGNWPELAPAHGLDFPDDADNATKLAIAYERLGNDLFARLRGEFAIVIYDRRARTLLAVRDVPGCRPMFYESKDGRTYVATEIRQVVAGSGSRPELDDEMVVHLLLSNLYPPGRTHLADISRFTPGTINRTSGVLPASFSERGPYWWPPTEDFEPYDVHRLSAELRELLDRSLAERTTKIPFALLLSGGLDSSSLWALLVHRGNQGDSRACRGRPYSIAYPGFDCDESPNIRSLLAATDSDGTFVDAASHSFVGFLDSFSQELDGIHNGVDYGTELAARSIRADGRQVAITGSGADEWLFGSLSFLKDNLLSGRLVRFASDLFRYQLGPRDRRLRFVRRFTVDPVLHRIRRALRLTGARTRGPTWLHPDQQILVGTSPQFSASFNPEPGSSGCRQDMFHILSIFHRSTGIENVEQVLARYGIEARNPYMDLKIIEFAFRTPGRAHSDAIRYKQLLRVAVADLLPASIAEQNEKVSMDEVLRRDVPQLERLLPPDSWLLTKRKIVTDDGLKELFETASHHSGAIMTLINLAAAECLQRVYSCSASKLVAP